MKKILVRVPMRADLAGGTLDLWPIHLFQPRACTVNVAISYHAECEVTKIDHDNTIEVALLDLDYRQRYDSFQDLANDPKAALVFQVLDHFRLSGVRVATRSDAPRGSGLGASSALSVALLRAASEIVGQPLEGEDLVPLVRDLETRLLGLPAGIQDYYPPVYGGLATLRLEPGRITRQQLSTPLPELTRSMVIHYSGVSHFSGTNNWEIFKRFLDGEQEVREGLARIAETASRMAEALDGNDIELAGRLLAEEWENRKRLVDGVSTPEIERIVKIANDAGAFGAKVCGAGGGGCVVILIDPDRRDRLVEDLSEAPGFTVNAVPVPYGLEVFSPDDSLTSRKKASWRIRPAEPADRVEELWVAADGDHARNPYLVAEASITFDASRRGAVHTASRRYVAPIRVEAEKVEWALLRPFTEDQLDLVPVSPLTSPDARSVEAAMRVVGEASPDLAKQIAEQETLSLFRNAPLELLSELGESREKFVERCLDVARERSAHDYEQLEATLRLKIEQVRERYERELSTMNEEEGSSEGERAQSSFPWGQVVHDILSGREPAMPAPSHPVESDLHEKITQHRKHWTRDVENFDEQIRESAGDVEIIHISPTPDQIEIDRHLVVWAKSLDSFPPID